MFQQRDVQSTCRSLQSTNVVKKGKKGKDIIVFKYNNNHNIYTPACFFNQKSQIGINQFQPSPLGLDLVTQLPRLEGIDKRGYALVAPSRANRDPDVLLRRRAVNRLAVTPPAQALLAPHGAVAEPAVGYPLLDDRLDKVNLAAKVVGRGDALQLRVNLGSSPGRPRGVAAGRRRRLVVKVEQRL